MALQHLQYCSPCVKLLLLSSLLVQLAVVNAVNRTDDSRSFLASTDLPTVILPSTTTTSTESPVTKKPVPTETNHGITDSNNPGTQSVQDSPTDAPEAPEQTDPPLVTDSQPQTDLPPVTDSQPQTDPPLVTDSQPQTDSTTVTDSQPQTDSTTVTGLPSLHVTDAPHTTEHSHGESTHSVDVSEHSSTPSHSKAQTQPPNNTKTHPITAHITDNQPLEPSVAKADDTKYSWWKIVVTLVVFCALAGIILWSVRIGENCKQRRAKSEEDLSVIEEGSNSSGEKISTSKV